MTAAVPGNGGSIRWRLARPPLESDTRGSKEANRQGIEAGIPVEGIASLHPLQEADHRIGQGRRSEEHTSELQSLMRISYAVFCLKKKKKKQHKRTNKHH